jgi:hypothetical protein
MLAGPFESHTLAGRRFAPDADDDVQMQLGGKSNEVMPNGDGTVRVQQSRVPASLEGANLIFDPENGDVEYLQELREKGNLFDYSGTTNDGTIYAGSMQITGDLKFSFKEGKVSITLKGSVQKQG